MSDRFQTQSSPPTQVLAKSFRTWGRNTFAALEVRDFRLFYIGQGMSLTGTWMRRTALGWVVFELTGSYELLGLVMGMALLPLFVFAPVAGSLADRMDKRRLIIYSQILASAVSGVLAAIIFLDVATVWMLMVLATLGGVAFSFEVPARQAYVFEMVGRERLMNAIALNSAMVNLSRVFGPALAGLLMGWIGAGYVFAADAMSYLLVIGTLLAIRTRPKVHKGPKKSHWRHLVEGIHATASNRPVRTTLILLFLVVSCGWSYNTLLPAIAQDILHLSEARYGVLMSMFGVGAIAGALFVAGRGARTRPRGQMYGGVVMMLAALALFTLTRDFWTMMPFLAIAGFGGIMFLSTANTVIQMNVEDEVRGRVMGIWSLVFGGSLPLGSFVAGWMAGMISPFTTIQVFLLACAVGTAAILFVTERRRRVERLREKRAEHVISQASMEGKGPSAK